MMFSRPQLCIFHAWSLFATGQQAAAEPCIQAAEQALETRTDRASESTRAARGPLSGSDETKLRGRLATTRAFFAFYRGDAPAIIRHSRQALECLPEQDLAWRSAATNVLGDAYDFQGEMAAAYQARLAALEVSRAAGNSYQRMIANAKLAIILRQQGWLQRVTEICQQQVQMARERGMSQTVVAGWLRAMWGEVLAELNDLVGAREQASTGVELAERGGEVAMLGSSYLWLTRVLFSGGDMSSAQELVHRMDYAAQEFDMPPWLTNQMATWQARIWLAENKLDAAAQWARERGLDGTGEPTYPQEAEYIVLARLLVAQERPGDATTLLQRLFEAAEAGGRISRVIEILVLEALACQAAGNTAQAITALERALALSEPGGFVRTFADEGPTMARLLYGAAVRGVRQDHARRLLTAFHGFEEASVTQSKLQSLESAIIEPLSEREIEVLQLIAAGLTNQEIASRLFLTLNTVKAHTRNVYGKLGVHSRTQAVARARAVGILPST
jgi:LuxR family maltose regulon positive regulatory protein